MGAGHSNVSTGVAGPARGVRPPVAGLLGRHCLEAPIDLATDEGVEIIFSAISPSVGNLNKKAGVTWTHLAFRKPGLIG